MAGRPLPSPPRPARRSPGRERVVTEIRTQIDIDAGKETVWSILTDFAAYPEWNPFLVKVETRARPGEPVGLTVRLGGRTLVLDARIAAVTPERHLRWIGPISKAKGMLFTGEHYFVIQELTANRVRFVHGEEFSGLVVPVIRRPLLRALTPAYEAYNVALKRRAESADARLSAAAPRPTAP